MSDNWIVQNLNSALNTWNEKLAEIWTLLTQSPESFKGGTIWSVITGINGALTAIGYGLLVLFFAAGIVKTCGSFTDMKKPEHALKAFIRFALAQGAIMYMEGCSSCICILPLHPSLFPPLRENPPSRWERTLSSPMQGYVWKGRSLHWPVSFSPFILPVHQPLEIRP